VYGLTGEADRPEVPQISEDLSEKILDLVRPKWLDTLFQIVESLPQGEKKIDEETITKRYQLIVNILLDVIKLKILSEDQLSHFLNNNKNTPFILSHILYRINEQEGRSIDQLNIEEFIEECQSSDVVEAQLLTCKLKLVFLKTVFSCLKT
jgi:hypothetical protein